MFDIDFFNITKPAVREPVKMQKTSEEPVEEVKKPNEESKSDMADELELQSVDHSLTKLNLISDPVDERLTPLNKVAEILAAQPDKPESPEKDDCNN